MKNSKIPSLFSVDSKILARRKNRLFFDRVALDVETFNFPIYTKIDESHILCTIEKLYSAMCILRSPRFNSVFILFSVFDDRKLRHPISYTNPPPSDFLLVVPMRQFLGRLLPEPNFCSSTRCAPFFRISRQCCGSTSLSPFVIRKLFVFVFLTVWTYFSSNCFENLWGELESVKNVVISVTNI